MNLIQRIESGDVEVNLRALQTVCDAVVIPVVNSGAAQCLPAFLILVSQIAERLSAYMLPSKFIFLDVFPMTVNGKVDRPALARSL